MDLNQAVQWPAIIHCEGDDELTFVADQQSWLSDEDLSSVYYDQADRLIDSEGQLFALTDQVDGVIRPLSLHNNLQISELAELLRKHFSVTGACCLSKIQPDSIASCMAILQDDQSESKSNG